MRVFSLILSFLVLFALPTAASAAKLGAPGPNPNWTDMQQFEWYIGYMSRAAALCREFSAGNELQALALMTPYGVAGMKSVGAGDGFVGAACGRIGKRARELAADAEDLRRYIEATYNCKGTECHGQSLSDWKFHECGDPLEGHLALLGIDDDDIRAVTMMDPKKLGSKADFLARVQFHSCKGSLYIDMGKQCSMEKSQTRGDCAFDGVERY